MKYLVTGGAGFIGSNIAKTLVANGEEVRIMDNFETGRKINIEPIIEKIELFKGDLTNPADCKIAVKNIDYIFHEGAIPSVPRSVEDPIKTNLANITGTLNILSAAKNAEVKRLIYAGSSSAYGNTPTMPKVETMPTNPLSPYALQKLTGEHYCRLFTQIYNLETIVIRYFNVFGPNQDPTSVYAAVIPIFIKKILKDESPTIFGDGETSRDFTFVENIVHANLLAARAPEEAVGEVFNIAMGERTSLNELVEMINNIMGKNIKPRYEKERVGDVKHSLADISKAKKLLKYEPVISFEEGLRKTVEYYQKDK